MTADDQEKLVQAALELLRGRDERVEMMHAIIARNTDAIVSDTVAKHRLSEAIEALERRSSVTPPPQTFTVRPRWAKVTMLAALVGSVVACAWITAAVVGGQAVGWIAAVL